MNSYNKNPGQYTQSLISALVKLVIECTVPGFRMLDWLFSDPLPVGAPAPDFSLPDQNGSVVSLAALRGCNVVLIFYPGDDTTVCRQQLCEFRDHWAAAQQKNTLVYGVNPQNAQSHAK